MAGGDSRLRLAINRFKLDGYVRERGGRQISKHEWLLDCPHCGKPEKVTVNTRKRGWHCWVCQKKGPQDPQTGRRRIIVGGGGVLRLMQWLEGVTVRQAAERVLGSGLSQMPIGYLDLELESFDDEDGEALPDSFVAIDPPEGALPVTEVLPYMARRRLTLADAQTFGLMWVPPGRSRYSDRLVFPVWQGGALVYWQARAMWDPPPGTPKGRFVKTLNPTHVDQRKARSDRVLFNLEQAARYGRICLTEGPIDAIRTGPDAVASFGKVLHQAQIAAMLAAGVTAVDIMWDGPSETEPQGTWQDMLQAAGSLSGLFEVRLVALPYGDPGDSTTEALRLLRANAVPYGADHLLRL